MDLKDLFKNIAKFLNRSVTLDGWIRNNRDQKTFGFIDFSDGTCQEHLQIVYDTKLDNFADVCHMLTGSAIEVTGKIVKSEGKQAYELKAERLILLGNCPSEYPIQPKRHTREFLREQAYLRPRTNLFQAVFSIRSGTAQAIHTYFQEHNYVYVHTPLITTTDCEGSNQMFKITTLDFNDLPIKDKKIDLSHDLFGKQTYITGSGQLHGEAFATAFKKIYTFGPTFRTENSNTKTHANEFWMIEPEIAFCDINGLMDIEEEMLKFIVEYVLNHCSSEIDFCDKYIENGLKDKLERLLKSKFTRITHKEVIDILKAADIKWEFTPSYNDDIAKEHEKYITEYFNGPVFITNWPKGIKAWYMKTNPDNETVAAVDLEVPGAGELMGGSQREEKYDVLIKRAKDLGVNTEVIDCYLNLRKYGTCIHSGFGMGFERLIIYLTGIENIRDVIPFPRTPGNCDY